MSSIAPLIKERLSIVDVLSSYLTIEQSGKNYKAKCPFHNEKTPSFFISPDRGSYYCFGCSAKGDIFSFVEHFEGTDFLGALKILADRAGVPLDTRTNNQSKDEKERWYAIMEEATLFFQSNFANDPSARAYLITRGLNDASMEAFRIGYVPNVWRSVSDHLTKKGFSQKDLEIVGLIKKTDSGFYDRFRGRIMFPISDSSGRVIAFSGRIFGRPDEDEAKYLNSPDTPLFNKSNVLFGIDKAKSAIRARGYSIIVEGQMDLILSHQASFTNTVAVSGTALADATTDNESKINNLGLIRRLSPNVIFAFDGDSAGIRAAGRSAMIALSLDMQVKIAVLPEGKDPADIILEDSNDWKDIIKNAVNIVSFHIDRICKSTTDTRIRGRQIREIVFPYLSVVKSSIERNSYINEIYRKTGIQERAVIEDFEKYERTNINVVASNQAIQTQTEKIRKDLLASRLFGIMFWKKDDNDFAPMLDKLKTEFKDAIGEDLFKSLEDVYIPDADTLSFEAEMWYGGKTEMIIRDFTELVLNLEQELLQEKRSILNQSQILSAQIISEIQEIDRRIENIKNRRTQ